MPQLINWGLIREPMNWFIVVGMLLIFAFSLYLLTGVNVGTVFQ